MITDYFTTNKKSGIQDFEYFELRRSFIEPKLFKNVYNEIEEHLVKNAGRKSCVCVDDDVREKFNIYNLPLIDWTDTIENIKNKILNEYNNNSIDYGLVHYYHDDKSVINWHSDREALRSNIYSISLGNPRRFCLRDKITKKVYTFDLYDGDLIVMKKGCQERFEHCIKSIKMFNKPRISITFRKLEETLLYYVYDKITNNIVVTNKKCPDYVDIHTFRQGIQICVKNDNIHSDEVFINPTRENLSLLKSNLQKAIRRQNKTVALSTALKMIYSGMTTEMIRRLTIITIEDVYINSYYPKLVWYYIALSTNNYILNKDDVSFLLSYVRLLCDINITEKCDFEDKHKMYYVDDVKDNVYCLALYIRIQYGGFKGEINLINNLIYKILNHEIDICEDKMVTIREEDVNPNCEILDCAIDHHCFPNMPSKVLARINEEYDLTEEDIKYYIFKYESSVNTREKNSWVHENELKIWNTVIKPKCEIYKQCIKRMLML